MGGEEVLRKHTQTHTHTHTHTHTYKKKIGSHNMLC